MKRYYAGSLTFFLFIAASLSFYIFSRFTVDDAFISWRYGKNLVDHGIWNYNPSNHEFVQAYTNPLFAFLSIVPNYIGMDVVLFFKIASLFTIFSFAAWSLLQSIPIWMIFLILAIPSTQIHIYSGLETFTYCFLLAWVFICLQEQKIRLALFLTVLVCMVRPEAWMLCAISPLALSINKESIARLNYSSSFREIMHCINFRSLLCYAAPVALALSIYLITEYRNFGDVVPNTFKIKSGHQRPLDTGLALVLVFFMTSLALFFKREFIILFVSVALYMIPVIYVYSRSDLQMNYASRFVFHVAMVMIIIMAKYSAGNQIKSDAENMPRRDFFRHNKRNIAIIAFTIILSYISSKDAMGLANYYPRALESHAELGKVIAKNKDSEKLNSFSFGDAGMAAYHSEIFSIDNMGLANKAIGRGEFSQTYLDIVAPKLVLLYGNQNGIYSDMGNQATLMAWMNDKGYRHQCAIYWRPDYLIYVYGKEKIPDINELCEKSRKINGVGDLIFMKNHINTPPWRFWKE